MWNEYNEKMKYRRNSRKEYQKRNLEKVVKNQFDNINSHDVFVESLSGDKRQQKLNIFAKTSAKTTNTMRSHQRFFISLEPLKAGEKIEWNDSKWIVLTSSNDKEVYYEGFLLKSNTRVSWSYSVLDEETGKTYKQVSQEDVAVYDSGRLEGIYDENEIKLPDGQRRVIMPASEASETLKRGETRFSFDNKVYRLIDSIVVEQEGIKFLVMDEVLASKSDKNPEPESKPEPEEEEETTQRYLSAPDFLYPNEEYEIRVVNSSSPNNWFFTQGEKFVDFRIVGQRMFLTLKDVRNIVGEEITVQVVENTGWTDSKTMVVRSILWRD